ncbi:MULTISPECIES: hypothetical protein [Agrobacterium]|uniref:hypothetical protein n=1 Tax=Agrobacterium tumefaciens TaxID=358 RepID=UPI00122FE419|nr:hypothetical protein DXM29_04580 [Agrobacterium tumefaciens]NSY05771.1 hypothetical protein [Agrobacterium tumefaciens]NSZ05617.1 hypothetical protein [Agrobacterium tumefaciens]
MADKGLAPIMVGSIGHPLFFALLPALVWQLVLVFLLQKGKKTARPAVRKPSIHSAAIAHNRNQPLEKLTKRVESDLCPLKLALPAHVAMKACARSQKTEPYF